MKVFTSGSIVNPYWLRVSMSMGNEKGGIQ